MRFNKEEQIISDFLKSIGPWKYHIVIGGGFAPIIYKLYLTDPKKGNPPVGTRDLDSLISRRISKISSKNIAQYLREAGFSPIFKDFEIPATEAYIKEISSTELEVEFLTDKKSRRNQDQNVVIEGIAAQPLRYLELSLQKKIAFTTYSHESGFVVSPGTWAFHKGLTFQKRRDQSKIYKDLYGIWYVTTQLGELSSNAITEIHFLEKEYPKWFQTFQRNLVEWVENASPQDWAKLEIQDPFGELKKINFEYLLKEIL